MNFLEVHVYGPSMYIDKIWINPDMDIEALIDILINQHGGLKERVGNCHFICNDTAQVEIRQFNFDIPMTKKRSMQDSCTNSIFDNHSTGY